MNFKKGNTSLLRIVGVISIITICSVVIYFWVHTAKETKIKELNAKTLELKTRIAAEQVELDSIQVMPRKFRTFDYYVSIKDSLSKIIGTKPSDDEINYIKGKIEDKINSINWIQKNIPKKRYFSNKKNNGIPLGYWEEEDDANIENIEVEYGMPIEKYIVQEREDKAYFEKELLKLRGWSKNHNLTDLENKLQKVQIILGQMADINTKILSKKEDIKNMQKELKSLQ